MAHLTARAPPFRRPIVAEARAHFLPSPPDTDADFAFNPSAVAPPTNNAVPELEPLQTTAPQRRTSIMSYTNTPFRDAARERPVSRISRWLLVVVPSPSIVTQIDSVPGVAPRPSQGTLMPLVPTLYGQLTAIAREFNFPSAVGLCIFLHFNDHGVSITPRITEETWIALWAHLFDARSPSVSLQQLPICGRIEVDIDMQRARWYDSWAGGLRRRMADPTISAAPSISHRRMDSRTSMFDERVQDDQSDVLPPSRSRNVPRALSLIDKLETGSVASYNGLRTALQDLPEAESDDGLAAQDLDSRKRIGKQNLRSNRELAVRVNSWRESSSVAASPIAATGQVSLDAVHIPNNVPIPSPPHELDRVDDELNLNDFQWSVSSEGPYDDFDYEYMYTPLTWQRPPSVHLAGRLVGSVALSPSSIGTSFGPDDDYDYLNSPVSWSRLSSVDLARRNEGSVQLTSSYASSWGLEYDDDDYLQDLPSPYVRAPSVDLAQRNRGSVPVSPWSATWGPNDAAYLDRRVDSFAPPRGSSVNDVVYPDFELYKDNVIWMVEPADTIKYPDFEVYPGHVVKFNESRSPAMPRSFGKPSSSTPLGPAPARLARQLASVPPAKVSSDGITYPDIEIYPGHVVRFNAAPPAEYPYFEIYSGNFVLPQSNDIMYPNLEIYAGNVMAVDSPLGISYPDFEIYLGNVMTARDEEEEVQYPNFEIYSGNLMLANSTSESVVYPNFEIYNGNLIEAFESIEMAYPHFEIYDGHRVAFGSAESTSDVLYPNFEIYSGNLIAIEPTSIPSTITYPNFEIYSGYLISAFEKFTVAYPDFEIYPGHVVTPDLPSSVEYPDLEVYPGYIMAYQSRRDSNVSYPNFEIYTGHIDVASQSSDMAYPNFEIYAGHVVLADAAAVDGIAYPDFEIYAGHAILASHRFVGPAYPDFEIYAGHTIVASQTRGMAYPDFEIYAGHCTLADSPSTSGVAYPDLEIYAGHVVLATSESRGAVYPDFEIYEGHVIVASHSDGAVYPDFEIYAGHVISASQSDDVAAYPDFEIYSGHVVVASPSGGAAIYPDFEIYAGHAIVASHSGGPTYPDFEIYTGHVEVASRASDVQYPDFEIYSGYVIDGPARPRPGMHNVVYPNFELYPGQMVLAAGAFDKLVRSTPSYPVVQYPHFEIFPGHIVADAEALLRVASSASGTSGSAQTGARTRRTHKSHSELHAEVFPRKRGSKASWASIDRPRRTHAQLHAEVFALLAPGPPLQLSDQRSPVPWTPIAMPDMPWGDGETKRGSLSSRRESTSRLSQISTKSTRSQGPLTPHHGHGVLHRRTGSTESIESIDSQTGLPRRRDPPPIALRAPITRHRSSSIAQPPPVPPIPEVAQSPVIEEEVKELPPAPAPAPKPVQRRLSEVPGLPSKPAENVRRTSTAQAPVPAHTFPTKLSPVEERPPSALQRTPSLTGRHERKSSIESILGGQSRRRARDSVVLEKAKMFDQASSPDEPRRSADFPTSTVRSNRASRPVSKLDRSKIPFV